MTSLGPLRLVVIQGKNESLATCAKSLTAKFVAFCSAEHNRMLLAQPKQHPLRLQRGSLTHAPLSETPPGKKQQASGHPMKTVATL